MTACIIIIIRDIVYGDNLLMTHSEVLPTLIGIIIPNIHSILVPFISLLAIPTAVEFTWIKFATPRALIFINVKGPHWGGEAT